MSGMGFGYGRIGAAEVEGAELAGGGEERGKVSPARILGRFSTLMHPCTYLLGGFVVDLSRGSTTTMMDAITCLVIRIIMVT